MITRTAKFKSKLTKVIIQLIKKYFINFSYN